MKYLIKNIRIPVQAEQTPEQHIHSILKLDTSYVSNWQISRKALDTRKRNHPAFVYTLELDCSKPLNAHPDIIPITVDETLPHPDVIIKDVNPYIIGMGPSGLFCALAMVEHGLKPVLIDRGEAVEQRAMSVSDFWSKGVLNPESNVQFGEGGAGAFSDGKLTSRTKNPVTAKVFEYLIRFGAPEAIRYEALPHLGTDGIRGAVKNIRAYLEAQGCLFYINHRLQGLKISKSFVTEALINGDSHQPEIVVLALGNAARDTFRMLDKAGVNMENKPFSLGFRISHPQDWIDEITYGNISWANLVGAASYRLTGKSAGKGTYTFCMCPGGHVIAASSQIETAVTNGMSYASRKHKYGNSAVVTAIDKEDYGSGIFAGMQFQTMLENRAFRKGYAAPYQTTEDYLSGKMSSVRGVDCLFPSAIAADINDIFPAGINHALQMALKQFDRTMPGFIREGMLIAPETRTSSPIRILRSQRGLNCLDINNLYAVGEGSGYAGGIISSAADGYRIGLKFTL